MNNAAIFAQGDAHAARDRHRGSISTYPMKTRALVQAL
jgi:hypothetical protein